ncbi:MAG: hypothetical protein AAGG44_17875 [Planctomycetota bacterium]
MAPRPNSGSADAGTGEFEDWAKLVELHRLAVRQSTRQNMVLIRILFGIGFSSVARDGLKSDIFKTCLAALPILLGHSRIGPVTRS